MGSIVVYKVVFLICLLVKVGVEVQVFMMFVVVCFVQLFIFVMLSKCLVYIDVIVEDVWNNYVEFGFWVDVMLVVLVIVNILVKLVNGICDNIIVVVYLLV